MKLRKSIDWTYSYKEIRGHDNCLRLNPSIYKQAKYYDELELYRIDGLQAEKQLKEIPDLIKFRIKLTQYETFKIGALLWMGKKACRKTKKKFTTWRAEHFSFSDKMANNFMNVYKYCLAHYPIALKVDVTLLYNLSAPNFPDELRTYLFEKVDFDKITSGKLKNLQNKFLEGGFEAVEKDVSEITRTHTALQQMDRRLDIVKSFIIYGEELIKKYEAGIEKIQVEDMEIQFSYLEPEAAEISKSLYKCLCNSNANLKTKFDEAYELREELIDRFNEKM